MQDTRMFLSTTFFRVATPFREMSWADFLLADILTSLAKPLSDCERALCHLLSGPVMLPHSTDQVATVHALFHYVFMCRLFVHTFIIHSGLFARSLTHAHTYSLLRSLVHSSSSYSHVWSYSCVYFFGQVFMHYRVTYLCVILSPSLCFKTL